MNKKKRQLISIVIVAVLVVAMVLPLVLQAIPR